MTSLIADPASGRSLLPRQLFDRLVTRIVTDERMDRPLAERIMDQALAFLKTCADTPIPLSPSRMVDIGWHTFILYTREYELFCHRVAGRFIHHEPTDLGRAEDARPVETLSRTVEAILATGLKVDVELWSTTGTGDCSQCHNGCSDDPPPRG